MKKPTLLLLFLFCLLYSSGFAQSYDLSAGMRLGTDWGASARLRVAKKTTVETILQSSFKRNETMLTVMALKHNPVLTRRFNVFVGGGLHKGWQTDQTETETYDNPFGISLVGGIEFTLARVNLSYDIKPAINLSGGAQNVYLQSGISIRYVMVKKNDLWGSPAKKRKKKRQKARAQRKKDKEKNGKGNGWKFWKKDN